MCPDCFPDGIYGFPSRWAYEDFEQLILRKPLTMLPAEKEPLAKPVGRFACLMCREVWVLSEPGGAWRGYFLSEPAAAAYIRRLRMRDKARRLCCFGLFLAALYYWWRWW